MASLPPADRLKFAVIVRRAMKDLKMTQEELGEVLGYNGHGMVNAWLSENRWPDDDETFGRLCEVLKLPVKSKTEAEAKYQIDGWRRRTVAKAAEIPTMEDWIERLRCLPPFDDGEGRTSQVYDVFTSMVDTMDEHNFIAITTQTRNPVPLRSYRNTEMKQALYRAISRGAVVLFIIPTSDWLKKLEEVYHQQGIHPHAEFLGSFAEFRQTVIAEMKEVNGDKTEYDIDSRLQLFEWDEFTGCSTGDVVTVIGEGRGNCGCKTGLIRRIPTETGSGFYVEPDGSINQGNALNFIEAVILNRGRVTPPAQLRHGTEAARLHFVRRMQCRMWGGGD